MDDLVQWLSAQLDEDEEEARRGYLKAEPLPDYDGWDKSTVAGLPPIVAARVLREIDAKRKVLDEHQDVNDGSCGTCVDGQWGYPTHGGSSPQRYPCRTLRLLALPYAGRDGYQEAWRP